MKHDYATACRFFTAEDACRFALAAYYAAVADAEPPKGEPWFSDGAAWALPGDFAVFFLEQVRDRVAAAAMAAGARRSGMDMGPLWWLHPGETAADLNDYYRHLLGRLGKYLPPSANSDASRQPCGVQRHA